MKKADGTRCVCGSETSPTGSDIRQHFNVYEDPPPWLTGLDYPAASRIDIIRFPNMGRVICSYKEQVTFTGPDNVQSEKLPPGVSP